jgi:SulP family sulfate permease
MGMKGFLPGLAAALACAGAVFAGTEYLAYVPAGLMAMVVSYLGFDLLGSWLLESRHRLPASEFAVVGLIVLTAATFGVLEALTLGMLAAAAIFIVSYANTGVLRFRSTAATRRSRVERSEEAMQHLARSGDACVVLELSGYVFFGTADRLARMVGAELEKHEVRFVIIDFGRVTGLDASALLTLTKVLEAARAARVEVTFCAVQPEQKRQFLLTGSNRDDLRFDETTDSALERVEDRLLGEADLGNAEAGPSLLELVEKLEEEFAGHPDVVRRIELSPGGELLSKGAASSEVYVLVEGRLRAEIETADGARLRVAEFREAALVGELAFYAGVERTAWVSAERPSVVVRIDLDRAETTASPTLLSFHKAAARSLARRVIRMTEYTRELNG